MSEFPSRRWKQQKGSCSNKGKSGRPYTKATFEYFRYRPTVHYMSSNYTYTRLLPQINTDIHLAVRLPVPRPYNDLGIARSTNPQIRLNDKLKLPIDVPVDEKLDPSKPPNLLSLRPPKPL